MDVIELIAKVVLGGFLLFNAANHFLLKRDVLVGYAAYKSVPYARAAILGTGALLVVIALAVFGIFQPIAGIIAAALFFIPVSVKMHDFWNAATEEAGMELVQFSKNMAILAGVILALV
jgi:hypothetical protein